MEDSSNEGSDTDEDDEEVAPKKRQIFFCSRTHSQLSQFVKELHRTPFAETLSVAATAGRKVRPTSAQHTWLVQTRTLFAETLSVASVAGNKACTSLQASTKAVLIPGWLPVRNHMPNKGNLFSGCLVLSVLFAAVCPT